MKKSSKRVKKSGSKPKKLNQYTGKLSLVIPCYNESGRIPRMISALERFDAKWKLPYELIIVDDGSKDDTAEKVNRYLPGKLTKLENHQVISLEKNQGKGQAIKTGVKAATGDHILTLDADMATGPNELFNWLNILSDHTFSDSEILIASREDANSKIESPSSRKVIGNIFNIIIQFLTSLRLRDTQCGFKLYPTAFAKQLFSSLRTKGWAHDVELLYRADLLGIPIRSLPVSWKHIDGTKISVVKDSFRMFLQTLWISVFLKWEWFIVQPIKDLLKKTPHKSESSIFRLLFVLLALGLLFLMPALSSDYGISGDEHTQRVYGDKLLKYYKSDGESDGYLQWKNLKYYGGLFDYVAAALNPADDPVPPDPAQVDLEETEFKQAVRKRGDVYQFRHFLNSLTGLLMILFTGFLAKTITGSWRLGFLAMIFMALSPRIFGHSMNNPKDIPFGAAYAFTVLHLMKFIRELPKPGIKTILFIILGIATAINIRVGGILLIAYLGLFTGIAYLIRDDLRKLLFRFKSLLYIGGLLFAMAVLGYFGGMIFWPYARLDPMNNPLEALGQMSQFSTGIRMLFGGEHIWSDRVPWNYIPTWFSITAPIFMLVGLLAFPVLAIWKRKSLKALSLLLVAFAGIFPIAYAILNASPLYDGMRHFLFVYPMLAILAAWSWDKGLQLAQPLWAQAVIWLALGFLLILPLQKMIVQHPYQYIYFNELSGGIKSAYANYETDYWMNSMKGLCDWFLQNIPEAKAAFEAKKAGKSMEEIAALPVVRVGTNCYDPVLHYLTKLYPNIQTVYVRYHDREQQLWDYGFWYGRFIDRKYLLNNAWPPEDLVYAEKVGGVTIGAISKRGEAFDHEAYLAVKEKDFAKAIEFYKKEIGQHPKNEAAWIGIASSAMATGDYQTAKIAIDSALVLSDEDVSTLGMLGSYYAQTGDIPAAKETFEKAVQLNYKYTTGYYYLANFALTAQEIDKAADYIEKFDVNGGRIPAVFDWAVQIWEQKGNQARVLYYQAKKAFIEGKYQESYELLKRSVQSDKKYKPASELLIIFEKSIAENG